jgi:hypothetical protein
MPSRRPNPAGSPTGSAGRLIAGSLSPTSRNNTRAASTATRAQSVTRGASRGYMEKTAGSLLDQEEKAIRAPSPRFGRIIRRCPRVEH